jgi:hypothetical protein
MTPNCGGDREQSMLRKLVRAVVLVAICGGPAAAQPSDQSNQSHLSIPLNQKAPLTPEEIEKQKARDRDYDAAMKKIPDKKPSGDPWGDVRPTTSAKNKQQ